MKYTVNCCIIFSVTASPCIQSTVSEMQRTCRSKNIKRKKVRLQCKQVCCRELRREGHFHQDALPPGNTGLSLCATEPMARAAPGLETRCPSSMARHYGNNCLYNTGHGATEESARWAAPCGARCASQPTRGATRGAGALRHQGSTASGRLAPRLGQPQPCCTLWASSVASMVCRTLQPTQHHGKRHTMAVVCLVKGTPQPAWHQVRYGSALPGPLCSATSLSGLASVTVFNHM